jgi:hypothetical protein
MRHTLIFIATIAITIVSFGQTLKRQDNEAAETFVKRLKPDTTELAHPIIETGFSDRTGKSIIAFYGFDDPKDVNTGNNKIFGHLYLPVGKIEEDGGYPEIISVFFANADKDKARELIVLCKYEQRHYDYEGDFYETFIFDNPSKQNELTYYHRLSKKFFGCECGWRNGKTQIAKYKTAKEVRAELKKLGF